MNKRNHKNSRHDPNTIIIRNRTRQDLGDIESLMASLQTVGLLHPIVVNTKRELICGFRRLIAARRLGWSSVSVRIVDSATDAILALTAERDENTCREPFKPSELIELGRKIEALEKPKAKERQREGQDAQTKRKTASGKLPEANQTEAKTSGDTRDKVASALGVSGRTYEKAKAVVEAAEKEPERFGDLPAKMDQGGKVDPVFKELKARREVAAEPISEQTKLADQSATPIDVVRPLPAPPIPQELPRLWEDPDAERKLLRVGVHLEDSFNDLQKLMYELLEPARQRSSRETKEQRLRSALNTVRWAMDGLLALTVPDWQMQFQYKEAIRKRERERKEERAKEAKKSK